jgi:hypothetical protein
MLKIVLLDSNPLYTSKTQDGNIFTMMEVQVIVYNGIRPNPKGTGEPWFLPLRRQG